MTQVYVARTSEDGIIGVYSSIKKAWDSIANYTQNYKVVDHNDPKKPLIDYKKFHEIIVEYAGIEMQVDWFYIYVDPYTLNE